MSHGCGLNADPLHQQAATVRNQTSIAVRHEGLRCPVKTAARQCPGGLLASRTRCHQRPGHVHPGAIAAPDPIRASTSWAAVRASHSVLQELRVARDGVGATLRLEHPCWRYWDGAIALRADAGGGRHRSVWQVHLVGRQQGIDVLRAPLRLDRGVPRCGTDTENARAARSPPVDIIASMRRSASVATSEPFVR